MIGLEPILSSVTPTPAVSTGDAVTEKVTVLLLPCAVLQPVVLVICVTVTVVDTPDVIGRVVKVPVPPPPIVRTAVSPEPLAPPDML